MDLHPSFYQIIRKHRNDSSVSTDQFIAALISALNRSTTPALDCGHGTRNLNSGKCMVCLTIEIEREPNYGN